MLLRLLLEVVRRVFAAFACACREGGRLLAWPSDSSRFGLHVAGETAHIAIFGIADSVVLRRCEGVSAGEARRFGLRL